MNCETTYNYNAGTLETTTQDCVYTDEVNNTIFLVEFVLVFYVFITLTNYASGLVSRLVK